MMRMKVTRRSISCALFGLVLLAGGRTARSEPIIGLATSPNLVNIIFTFDSATPGTLGTLVPVTGVAPLETILGIDVRPTNGLLYGIGSAGNLYTIDPGSGLATLVAPLTPNPTDATNPFAGLSGTAFGIDFNPVPDLQGNPSYRVISNTGQNLRINANNGQVITDGTISGPAGLTIVGSAYINNDLNPSTGTTLYGIDSTNDQLVRSTDANAGTYVNQGPLGVDVSDLVAFDVSGTGIAYLAVTAPGAEITGPSTFHTIDLATGTPSAGVPISPLPAGFTVRGIAAQPSFVPEPGSVVLLGLGAVGLAGFEWRRRRRLV